MPGGPAGSAQGRWAAAALRGGAGRPGLARHGSQGGWPHVPRAAARTPGWSAGTRAPPRAPPPGSATRARSGDSPARQQAQSAVLGNSRRPSRAGRRFGGSLPPSPPAGLYKLGPRPPSAACPPPRCLDGPARPAPPLPHAPAHPASPQGWGWQADTRDHHLACAPRRPPPSPIALVLPLSVSLGTGRGRFSLADPARMLKKGSAPHAQLRPAWLERLSLWCRRRKAVAPPGDGGSARGPSPEDQHPVRLGLSGGRFQPHLSAPPALH